jgi:hypothetical protein
MPFFFGMDSGQPADPGGDALTGTPVMPVKYGIFVAQDDHVTRAFLRGLLAGTVHFGLESP